MQAVDLHFETFGEPESDPLIILHGFFASNRNWRHIARQLADQYSVFSLDLRNHGSSPHISIMDYPSMAEDLKAFMHKQGLSSAHIMGHSMGGKAAMWFALHNAALVQKLIIVDIAPVAYEHSFDTLLDALIELPLEQLTSRKDADDRLSNSIDNPVFRQFLLQNLILVDNHYHWRINLQYFKQAGPMVVGFPDSAELESYQGNAKFLVGENSHFVQRQHVHPLFPQAIIETIPNTGHWLHTEAPVEFLNAVRSALSENC